MPALDTSPRPRLCCVCQCPAERVAEVEAGVDENLVDAWTLYCHWHWIHPLNGPCHNCGTAWDDRLGAYVQTLPIDWPGETLR